MSALRIACFLTAILRLECLHRRNTGMILTGIFVPGWIFVLANVQITFNALGSPVTDPLLFGELEGFRIFFRNDFSLRAFVNNQW